MKKTGERLKKKRKELGYSISEISLSTKIATKIIEAIEQGDKSSLPPLSYLRGFIRTYAKHLKLDPDEMIEFFNQNSIGDLKLTEEQHFQQEITTESPIEDETKIHKPPKKTTKYKVTLGVIIVATTLLFIGTKRVINKYKKEASLSKEPLQVIRIEPTPKEPKKIHMVASSKKNNFQKSKNQKEVKKQIKKENKLKKKETRQTDDKRETQVLNAKNQNEEKETPKIKHQKVIDNEHETPEVKTNALSNAEGQPLYEVIVEATGHLKIKFKFGSGEFQSIALNPDQIHTFKSSKKITLDFSDGGSAKVFLNGRKYKISGAPGKPIKLAIPQ